MTKKRNEYRILAFRNLSREYSDTSILMHEAIARSAGLSGTDHKYLGILMQQGPMTAGELATRTGLTTGAITGLIDRLEGRGLARRDFDSRDRRKVIIVPNGKNAMKLLEPLFAKLSVKTTALIRSFSDSEISVLERYFQLAIDIMHEVTDSLNKKKDQP